MLIKTKTLKDNQNHFSIFYKNIVKAFSKFFIFKFKKFITKIKKTTQLMMLLHSLMLIDFKFRSISKNFVFSESLLSTSPRTKLDGEEMAEE
jgi:hypothetical protein